MDLDSLQQWIEALYHNVRIKKDIEEYHAQLLDDITRPWPFYRVPESIQDSFKAEIRKRKSKEEELSKLSEIDRELQTVNDILQEARLLQEKGTKPKRNAEKQINHKSAANNVDSNLRKVDLIKSQKPCENSNGVKMSKGNLAARKPLRPHSSRSESLSSKTTASKTKTGERGGNRISSVEKHKNLNKPLKLTSSSASTATSSPRGSPKEKGDSQVKGETDGTKKVVDLNLHASAGSQGTATEISKEEDVEVDLGKVKLKFEDIKAKLELPPKARKLLASHTKLKDQVGDILTQRECPEEVKFIKNMYQGNHSTAHYHPVRTLKSVNHELYHCIRTCANAIKVCRGLCGVSPGKTAQTTALASRTLDILGELYSHLTEKHDILKLAECVSLDKISAYRHSHVKNYLISDLPLHDVNGMFDDLPYPASTLTYHTPKEAVNWAVERLEYQFNLIEKDLLGQIYKTFFDLIDRTMEREEGNSPSPEFVHVLQNAYGLLANSDVLLPAYVAAE